MSSGGKREFVALLALGEQGFGGPESDAFNMYIIRADGFNLS